MTTAVDTPDPQHVKAPAKVAADDLAPCFSTARPGPVGTTLADRPAAATSDDHAGAWWLVLAVADTGARWGDFDAALRALEAAEALGTLAPEYRLRRERRLAIR